MVWLSFKQHNLSDDGRIIDPMGQKTTSEGQTYALFFSLVNNDPVLFDKLLTWTENNLAKGDLTKNLPAWLWGEKLDKTWGVVDENSASDADVWLAWELLEAGRLWKNSHYTALGQSILRNIEQQEVVDIPTRGKLLLPSKVGFIHENTWRLNPSYSPLQLFARFEEISPVWKQIRKNTSKFLIETSPMGFSPDWVVFNQQKGWDLENNTTGSYDAIRVYLWLGMLNDKDPLKNELQQHFEPIKTIASKQLPEKINIITGQTENSASVGFSAALLPFLQDKQKIETIYKRYITESNYYNSMLVLFGFGYVEDVYAFTQDGKLIPTWKN